MDDQVLLDQAQALTPVYVDGFGAFRKVNGVLRCIGYVLEGGAQLNLIVSLVGADMAAGETKRCLTKKATPAIQIWSGLALPAH